MKRSKLTLLFLGSLCCANFAYAEDDVQTAAVQIIGLFVDETCDLTLGGSAAGDFTDATLDFGSMATQTISGGPGTTIGTVQNISLTFSNCNGIKKATVNFTGQKVTASGYTDLFALLDADGNLSNNGAAVGVGLKQSQGATVYANSFNVDLTSQNMWTIWIELVQYANSPEDGWVTEDASAPITVTINYAI